MTVPGPVRRFCSSKVLRIERCVALDGKACSACAEDIELEREAIELGSCTETIHIKRRALRTAMNANHDPFIHRFPPEISSQIFIQIHEMESYKFYRRWLLYLGAVCQKWRQLAWATPQLWTSIFVTERDISEWPSHAEKLTAEWMERSARLPLNFKLECFTNNDVHEGVVNVLNKHSARWHNITFNLPARHLQRFCGSLERNTLRRLVICHPFLNRISSDFSTFSMKCKPSPTELELKTLPLIYVDISWNNLTVAELDGLRVDECVEVLRRSPKLETVKLSTIARALSVPITRLNHRRLRSLNLHHIRDTIVGSQILDSLCLPSLRLWVQQRSFLPTNNIISFIEYSSFSLKELKIIGTDQDEYDRVHKFLHHLSSLEFLHLQFLHLYQSRHPPATDELLDLLCASGESSPFLPCLRSLKFGVLPFAWESLPRIFASPNRESLRVKTLYIKSYRSLKVETAERLLGLVDEGFDLSVVGERAVDVLEEYKAEAPAFPDKLVPCTHHVNSSDRVMSNRFFQWYSIIRTHSCQRQRSRDRSRRWSGFTNPNFNNSQLTLLIPT